MKIISRFIFSILYVFLINIRCVAFTKSVPTDICSSSFEFNKKYQRKNDSKKKKEIKVLDKLGFMLGLGSYGLDEYYNYGVKSPIKFGLPVNNPVLTYNEARMILDNRKSNATSDDNNEYKYRNPNADKIFNLMVPDKKLLYKQNIKNSKILRDNLANSKSAVDTNSENQQPSNAHSNSNIFGLTGSIYKDYGDKYGPNPEYKDPESKEKSKKQKVFGLLPYLGFFVPTIALSPYTSIFTFFVEILSRKYYFSKNYF